MIFVVGGNPTKSRKAIEQRQPEVRRNIEKSRSPDRDVIVVVRNDGHGDCHKQGPRIDNRLESGEIPLHDEQCGGDRHVGQSATVGPMGKEQDELECSTFHGH